MEQKKSVETKDIKAVGKGAADNIKRVHCKIN